MIYFKEKKMIQITVKLDVDRFRTYTIYKEELEQIVCNKAREDNPDCKNIQVHKNSKIIIVI